MITFPTDTESRTRVKIPQEITRGLVPLNSWMNKGTLLAALIFGLFAPSASAASFLGFNPGPFYALLGTADSPTITTNVLRMFFDGPVPADTFISITSSNPAVLTVTSGGITILAGQTSAAILVTSVSLGRVTLTASYNGGTATATVDVVADLGSIPPAYLLNIEPLPGAVRLTWPTNAAGFLLETNITPANPAKWGVVASNYGLLATNNIVTNATTGGSLFYRLHKP